MKLSQSVVVLLCATFLASCGDEEVTPEAPQVDCPRMEYESLENCTFDEQLDYSSPETVDRYCTSPCKTLLSLNAIGPGDGLEASRDLKLLSGIEEIQRTVNIDSMKYLESVDGLDSLKRTGEGFQLHFNFELQDLQGLSSLESVAMDEGATYDFSLVGNRKLETLDGLESLKEVGMALVIEDHLNLRSIEALESLETVKYLSITGNPKLPTCQAEALAERLELPDDKVDIHGNGTGSCD